MSNCLVSATVFDKAAMYLQTVLEFDRVNKAKYCGLFTAIYYQTLIN